MSPNLYWEGRMYCRFFWVETVQLFVCQAASDQRAEPGSVERGDGFHVLHRRRSAQCLVPRRPSGVPYGDIHPLFWNIKNALTLCHRDHPGCGQQDPPLLPKRVIDVGSPTNTPGNVRLHIANPGQRERYACLSYCWGGVQQYTASVTNEADLAQQIDTETLGKTIQDAITMTRDLGLRYLWVDALCILQDSPQDKATEIKKMARIYGDATITLAIADATSANDGFLGPYPSASTTGQTDNHMHPSQHPLLLPPPHKPGTITLLPMDNGASLHETDIDDTPQKYPLELRGWALQEFLLSPRVLFIIRENMYWICKTWRYQPIYQPRPYRYLHTNCSLHLNEILRQGKDMTASDFHKSWRRIFNDYASRDLSDPGDRLNALTGVISVIEEARGEKCMFGHWPSLMPSSLAWQHLYPRKIWERACADVPSWSWAAWDATCWFPDVYEKFTPCSEILGVESDGTMKLRGRLPTCTAIYENALVDDPRITTDDSWLRVVLGSLELGHSRVRLVVLLLERTPGPKDNSELYCRRGVALHELNLPDDEVRGLAATGKEITVLVQ
ncbi:heterokaryon incompatibility protein-domain-containing protein [Cercophora newfieldiana]|uniref:Heterokaryon incompatibility protein-domain-containing protein n=1 Tax=Cercophora newfieldiana TaxID=92897 RepID=A0AA40CUS6_9PEZI|nr:heterokaryon incompatibility protein-domain-containing protein [Cercophora newfieldiana]